MSARRKFVCGGLIVLSCVSATGCAGKRLNNLFSSSAPADYKTLQQIAEEERLAASDGAARSEKAEEPSESSNPVSSRLASLRFRDRDAAEDRKPASVSGSVDSAAKTESAPPLNRLLGLGRKKESLEADPFLASPEIKAAAGKPAAQSESERLAELDRELQQLKKQSAEAVSEKKLADATGPDADDEAEQLFAELTKAANKPRAAAPTAEEIRAARAARTAEKPVDELEAFLSRAESEPKPDPVTRKTRRFHDATAEGQMGAKPEMQLTSAAKDAEDGGYEDMFKTLQAGFEQPDPATTDTAATAAENQSGANVNVDPLLELSPEAMAFDKLLAGSGDRKQTTAARPSTEIAGSGFDTLLNSNPADGVVKAESGSSGRAPQMPFDEPAVEEEESARRLLTKAAPTAKPAEPSISAAIRSASDNPFGAGDAFENPRLAKSEFLEDESGFEWKAASAPEAGFSAAGSTGNEWWNSAVATTDFAANSGQSHHPYGNDRTHVPAGMSMRASSMSGNPGFEQAPEFDTVSFENSFSDSPTGTQGTVAAVDSTPVVSLSGRLGLNSVRNWFLLMGAVVVAFLLFGPGRMKPAQTGAGRPETGK